MLISSRRLLAIPAVITIVLAAVPASAGESARFLPPDTEICVRFNLKQALASDIAKKLGVDDLKNLVKAVEVLPGILKDLEFDPFRDLETVTIAAPGGNDQERVLVLVRGKFKVEKFRAKGEELAKNSDMVKLHKGADGNVLEVPIPGQNHSLFMAVASDTTLLLAAAKDPVSDALKRGKAKDDAVLKNKDLQTLLEKMDPKQSLSVVATGSALKKALPDLGGDFTDKIDALAGGITLADNLKVEFALSAKTAQDPRDLHKSVNGGLLKGTLLLTALVTQNQDLAPFRDLLTTIRIASKEKQVTIKAEITPELMEKVSEAVRKLFGNAG